MLAAIQSIDRIYYSQASCGHRYLFLVTWKQCALADLYNVQPGLYFTALLCRLSVAVNHSGLSVEEQVRYLLCTCN